MLPLARALHRAGHEVAVADEPGYRAAAGEVAAEITAMPALECLAAG